MTGQSEKHPGWQNHKFSIPPPPCLIPFKGKSEAMKKCKEGVLLAPWIPKSEKISFVTEFKSDIFLKCIKVIYEQELK